MLDKLGNALTMKNLGETIRFLGISFKYNRRNKLELDQKVLIDESLDGSLMDETSGHFMESVSPLVY